MTDIPTPLAEARPTSLQEIMALDPFNYTRQDRDAIVAELRRARVNWDADKAAGKTRASKPTKPTMTLADVAGLKL